MRRWVVPWVGALVGLVSLPLRAAETTVVLDGEVPPDDRLYFTVPFEVPPGTLEIEIHHSDGSDTNILDWGLLSPEGFVGWGGGNEEDVLLGASYASRSYSPTPIVPGTWHVLVGKARIEDLPATYALEVVLRDEVTGVPDERQPWDPPTLSDEGRWYAGDLHVHSRESGDARPDLGEIATFARGRGLDFVVISDHNVHTGVDFFTAAQARHPDLLLVPGVEFTTYAGHAGGIGATQHVDFRVGDTTTIEAAVAAFHDQGAVFAINHPVLDLGALCIGCAWEHALDPALVDAVELTNGGGLQPFGWTFIDEAMAYWDALCDEGHHVAPIGGSDDHKAGVDLNMFQSPIGDGTTMVWAESLSPEDIVEGIRQGRTVVKLQGPSDPMIDFDASGREGDTVRGSTIALRATITGGQGQTARLVVDGSPEATFPVDADPFETTWTVEAPTTGAQRYRVEVLVDGALRTVTSHLWVEFAEVPSGTSSGGDAGSTGAARDSDGAAASTGRGVNSTGEANAQGDGNPGGCSCTLQPGRAWWTWGLIWLAAGVRRRGRPRP